MHIASTFYSTYILQQLYIVSIFLRLAWEKAEQRSLNQYFRWARVANI